MTMIRRASAARIIKFAGALGDRQVRVVCSSDTVDRMGDIIVQSGIDLSAYRRNPVVLWQHDADHPVARAIQIGLDDEQLAATVQFPPESTSETADEVYRLIKAGVVAATSIGFLPIEWEAVDRSQSWAGRRYTKTELLEFSFVSVPANPDALVVGKAASVGQAEARRRVALYRAAEHRGDARAAYLDAEHDRLVAQARRAAAPRIAAEEAAEIAQRAAIARSFAQRW